jgi:PEP-CTERM motif
MWVMARPTSRPALPVGLGLTGLASMVLPALTVVRLRLLNCWPPTGPTNLNPAWCRRVKRPRSARGTAAQGFIALITDSLGNVPNDSAAATLEVVAWDNSSGNYPTWTQASVAWAAGLIAAGKGGAFTVNNIGGSVNTPPNMPGQSFNLYIQSIPEPSTFALAGLGAAALLIFRRRK